MIERITVKTTRRAEFVDITRQVQEAIEKTVIDAGVCHVYTPHTTCGITVNEHADPDVAADMLKSLERMVPWEDGYAHAEGNSAAHVKSSLMGCSRSLFIEEGKLMLGTWQGIFLTEFDGPRTREVWVKVIKEE